VQLIAGIWADGETHGNARTGTRVQKSRRALSSSPDRSVSGCHKGTAIWDLLAIPCVMPTGATVSATAAHKRVAAARAGAGAGAAMGAATAATSDRFRRIDRVGCELIED